MNKKPLGIIIEHMPKLNIICEIWRQKNALVLFYYDHFLPVSSFFFVGNVRNFFRVIIKTYSILGKLIVKQMLRLKT